MDKSDNIDSSPKHAVNAANRAFAPEFTPNTIPLDYWLQSKEEISAWLKNHKVHSFTINPDLSVDVEGDVNLSANHIKRLPVRFSSVSRDFIASGMGLTSLIGSPFKVGGRVDVSYNELTDLAGSPLTIGASFYCSNNKLSSLKFGPAQIGGDFSCSHNLLENLFYAPDSGHTFKHSFFCSHNKLTSLKGSPKVIGGDFGCGNNLLTSLIGGPTLTALSFHCENNKLIDFKHCPKYIGDAFKIFGNPIESLDYLPEKILGLITCNAGYGSPIIEEVLKHVKDSYFDSFKEALIIYNIEIEKNALNKSLTLLPTSINQSINNSGLNKI